MDSQPPPQTQMDRTLSWLKKIEKITLEKTGRLLFIVRFYSDGKGYVTACTSPNRTSEIGEEGVLYFDKEGELISSEEHYELVKRCFAPYIYAALGRNRTVS
jgi:hypothetical protein